ncbi:hypothetical protein ACQEU3_43655 [Spirillospora sp. CA-253888]
MQHINLFEALALWFDGKSTLGYRMGVTICGHQMDLSMLTWGRVGKILAAISGFVVIIEIVGEDRINRFGEYLNSDEGRPLRIAITVIIVAAFVFPFAYGILTIVPGLKDSIEKLLPYLTLLGAVAMTGLASIISRILTRPVEWIGQLLAKENVQKWALIAGLACFALGFQLDLLAT